MTTNSSNKVKISKLLRGSSYFIAAFILVFFIFKLFNFSIPSFLPNSDDEKYQELIKKRYAFFALPMPEKVEFAGEALPIEDFDVREAVDKELLKVSYWHSELFLYLKRANRSFPVIEPILKENGIPDDFKYVAIIESGLVNVSSPAGAKGVWQFMAATAKEYGLEVNKEVDERYHLEKSTVAACKYLKDRHYSFKNWSMVAASYNMGAGGLNKNRKYQKENSYFDLLLNPETSRYIYRTVAVKLIFENPENYGFHFRQKDLYPVIPTHEVKVDSALFDLVKFAKDNGTNYKMLKYFNPWLRARRLTNKYKKTYYLKIPNEGARQTKMETNEDENLLDSI